MDATSDDGLHALTAIAFIGSVFSPHYARAQDRTPDNALPHDHVAINLALYGETRAWVFTETKMHATDVDADVLRVGGNTWRRTPDGVELTLNDHSTPWRQPIRGRITLRNAAPTQSSPYPLHPNGKHHWWPLMPVARIEVAMQEPALRWQGHAYHDANYGDEPLAQGFDTWTWMRQSDGAGTRIHYAARGRRGAALEPLSLICRENGAIDAAPMPAQTPLPTSRWGLRGHAYGEVARVEPWEDTPFYTRSRLHMAHHAAGHSVVHETLDLTRFASRWVRFLLPFRLRRLKQGGPAAQA